jgi:hypothetical protein
MFYQVISIECLSYEQQVATPVSIDAEQIQTNRPLQMSTPAHTMWSIE